ncbi:invasion associated locus B family protein [Roseobacteraceae bacterium S113]
MFSRVVPLVLAASLATSANAQTAATEDATTTDGEIVVQGELSTGAPAEPENALGAAYTRETSGDWELRCVRTETPESDPCQLYQLLSDQTGNAVSEVSIFRLPEGGDVVAGATIIVPLETLLTAQLTMAVDGANAKRYPFSFCNPVGCYARLGLTEAEVNSFKRGAKAQVQIRPFAAPDQTVTVDMSLSGFTAGFDKVTIVQNGR